MADLTPVVGRGLLGAVKPSNPWFLALGLAAVGIVSSHSSLAEDAPPKDAEPVTAASARAKSRAAATAARAKQAEAQGAPLVQDRYEDAAARFRKTASILERAAAIEASAAEWERKTVELQTQARRARTLVEQTETRRARALARLQELGLAPEAAPTAASSDESPSEAPSMDTAPTEKKP